MTRFLWLLAFALSWHGIALGVQDEVEIVHDPIECWPVDQFLLLRSSFMPAGDIQTAKFYFRASEQPDYYYLELTVGADPGGIAPKALPTTESVTYYIELVTRSFNSYRSEERVVPVESGAACQRRDPEAVYYTGPNPDITIGATRAGASALPPGFQADGIARFLDVTGIAAESGGGGVGARTIGIIAALGGGAGAALALSGGGGGSDPTTTSPIGGTTSSVLSSSTSTAIGGGSSSTTTTSGGGASTSSATTTAGGASTTTVIGSSTTTVLGGSTTTVVGSSTTTSIGTSSTTSAGTSTTTSVVGSSTTTSIGPSTTTSSASTTTTAGATTSTSSSTTTTTTAPPTTTTTRATTSVPSAPDVEIDISCSNSVVVNRPLSCTVTVQNNGGGAANSVNVTVIHDRSIQFTGSDLGCARSSATTVTCNLGSMQSGASQTKRIFFQATAIGSFTNRATVFTTPTDPDTSDNIDTATVRVTANLRDDLVELELSYRTALELEPSTGGAGQIVWNGAHSQDVAPSGEFVYVVTAAEGENRIAARWTASAEATGSWRFDFGASSQFVSGSIRVESGHVLSLSGSSIVFALRPGAPSPGFTIQVGEARRAPLLR